MVRREFLKLTAGLVSLPLFSRWAEAKESFTYPEVREILQQASPYSTRLLRESEEAPESYQYEPQGVVYRKLNARHFVEGSTDMELLAALDFMIHETTHFVSGALALHAASDIKIHPGSLVVMPDTAVRILVPATDVFGSREMVDFVNPTLRRSSRFHHYIDTEENSGTQRYGIYGLLNEFNAYHAGTRATSDLLKFYLAGPILRDSGLLWMQRLADVAGNLTAYQQFRGFILSYLAFAKANHPQIYAEVANEGDFARGFGAVDKAFEKVVADFIRELPRRVAELSTMGLALEFDGENLKCGDETRSLGLKEYRELQNAIDSDARIQPHSLTS